MATHPIHQWVDANGNPCPNIIVGTDIVTDSHAGALAITPITIATNHGVALFKVLADYGVAGTTGTLTIYKDVDASGNPAAWFTVPVITTKEITFDPALKFPKNTYAGAGLTSGGGAVMTTLTVHYGYINQ